MIIYNATKGQFVDDVTQNRLKGLLEDAFQRKTGGIPADSRVWANEYSRFALALSQSKLDSDVQVAIEYHISAAGRFRIDVLLGGRSDGRDNAVIVELKGWEWAEATDIEDLVWSPLNGGKLHNHPCIQAMKYKGLLERFNEDLRDKQIGVHSSAYLFNYNRKSPEPLEDARYARALEGARLFLAQDSRDLCAFLESTVRARPKLDVVDVIENGKLAPAPELIERVSAMLEGNEEFDLIDEQNEAYNYIKSLVLRSGLKGRHVFIVQGGPGTGKSVIAMRLLADFLAEKKMVFFVAPNRAFRETVVEYLARGNKGYREDGKALFQSSWSFHDVDYLRGKANDVLIVDEAHRLKSRAHMYMGSNMVDDVVRAARVTVFFVDETQRVQWNDIGSVETITEAAKRHNAKVHEVFTLKAQYRCNGSTGYLNWLDDVLQIRETANFDNWGDAQYDFRVFDDPMKLYRELKTKNDTNKARIIAGYAWEWPKIGASRTRGTKAAHVQAGRLSLPWNYEGENWATAKDGIDQVGCVHTSQGVEFDWLGVLIGKDLIYRDGLVLGVPDNRARTDKSLHGWKKDLKMASSDTEKEAVAAKVQYIIKSTYKVLLTRGRKGCFVWCEDPALRQYLRERVGMAVTI